MRKLIKYTLVSAAGVFEEPAYLGFMEYRDDAYLRDGLGLLMACDAMPFGRRTYQTFAKGWPPSCGLPPTNVLEDREDDLRTACAARRPVISPV